MAGTARRAVRRSILPERSPRRGNPTWTRPSSLTRYEFCGFHLTLVSHNLNIEMQHDVRAVARQFQIHGEFLERRALRQRPHQRHLLRRLRPGRHAGPLHLSAHQPQHLQKSGGAHGKHPARDGASWPAKLAGAAGRQPARADADSDARRAGCFIATRRATTGALISSSRRRGRTTPSESAAAGLSRRRRRLASSKNCWPTCPRRDCTTPSPISITRPNALPRWKRPSKPTPPTARSSPSRKLNLPCATRPLTGVLLDAEPAGARHAQRHQVQQRDARRRHGRGHLRD